jgi:dTDP-4-dehydrorhamnose reductase
VRILITGLNGTLAPHVARKCQKIGHVVISWNRAAVDPNATSEDALHQHIDALSPDGILHLGMGSEAWAAVMAAHMGHKGLPFLFTSTAMVFDADQGGPHHVNDLRVARDDYGRYKIRCEDAILAANPTATIARIGYQIDCDTRTGNNMVAHLIEQSQTGPIRASQSWVPATSQMADTAAGLMTLLALAQRGLAGGLHHLDSNAATALTYPQIVAWIGKRLNLDWQIEPTDDYRHDQRLLPAAREDTAHLPDLPMAKP